MRSYLEFDETVLAQTHGESALIARYHSSLRRMAILLRHEEGFVFLVVSGCESFRGPFQWVNSRLVFDIHNGLSRLRDADVDFELVFAGGCAFVETAGEPFDGLMGSPE